MRQELSVVTPQGSAGGVAAIRATPEGRLPAVDPIQPNSVWLGQPPWSTFIFTIKERRGETFKGRFETASGSYIRDVTGTVKDGKISWLSKDVRAIKGGVGGDNEGTIDGDKIDFIVRGSEAERSGRWSVRLKPPARE